MPLTSIQRSVMVTLAPFRSTSTYVGGGAALNRKWPRLSDDMDIFADEIVELQCTVEPEIQALRDAAFAVRVEVSQPEIVEIIASKYGLETRVQWFARSDESTRFFPATKDEELGFRLH